MRENLIVKQNFDPGREEIKWISDAKQNPEKFSPLYKKYHKKIFVFMYNRLNDIDLAHDLTSQVFVKALRYIGGYKDYGFPFSSWLYRIAKSEIHEHLRKNKQDRYVNIESIQIIEFVEDFNETYSEKEKNKLLKAIKSLKMKDLQLIEMKYFEKRSHKEISEILNITENNAKIKCFRALEKLKQNYLSSNL